MTPQELSSATESGTPTPQWGKWEVSVLFDAPHEAEAERIMEFVFDALLEENNTACVSLMQVRDVQAWEECRCRRGTA